METELMISIGGFPPLSARGCVQYFMPLESGTLRRTINGELVYTGHQRMHKYKSVILGEDRAAIALEGLWRGSQVRVGCIQRLTQLSKKREVLLERDPVDGSVWALQVDQTVVEILAVTGRKIICDFEEEDQEVFVSYRPWLDMRITDFSLTTTEWDLKTQWKLILEEV